MRLSAPVRSLVPLLLLGTAQAQDWFIDFSDGSDSNAGTAPATPFQHCPGDPAATGKAAATPLAPGDVVRFKGGTVYRGQVGVSVSGQAGHPIIFDGNTTGAFGSGRAVVDGGQPITGWKRCASADEAKGNPRWAEIFYADLPRPKDASALNLCSADAPLPIAQHPNPTDPFWQEDMKTFFTAPGLIVPPPGCDTVQAEAGTKEKRTRPLSLVLGNGKNTAIVEPLVGGAFTVVMQAPRTVAAVAIAQQPLYAGVQEVAFLGDGKELLRATLEKGKNGLQRFALPAPVEISRLTIKLLSAQPGETKTFTAIRQVAAFGPDGTSLLHGADSASFSDPVHINQPRADFYDGATFAFHGGNNHVLYLPVLGYDPATGTLRLPVPADGQYKQTAYAFFNSVHFIDVPGEYAVDMPSDPAVKTARVFLLPAKLTDGLPQDICASVYARGFDLVAASDIVVQGFLLRRQNGSALSASTPPPETAKTAKIPAPADDAGDDAGKADTTEPVGKRAGGIVFRDCEVMLVRGGGKAGPAIAANRIDGVTVERCFVHNNPGHTKGLVFHTCAHALVRDSRFIENSSTALDYYTCEDSQVIGNTIHRNLGSHSNGLTFYVGCKNILVEGNIVTEGNCALTFQQGENLVFRNNFLASGGRCAVIGIWPSAPLKNIQLLNNTILGSNPDVGYEAGIFTNAKTIEGLVIRNNIIDGLWSTNRTIFAKATMSNNLFTRVHGDLTECKDLLAQAGTVATDLTAIFVDAAHGDYRLRPGSPAIGAGAAVGVERDIQGKIRPTSRPADIGAYAFTTDEK